MIKRTNEGWVVYSENGKPLSRPYPTRQQAEERLREIDFFAKQKKK